jgi:hypothetical protein
MPKREPSAAYRWVNLSPATAGDVLREHFPIEVRCDHKEKRDKVFCNCQSKATSNRG